VKKLYIVERKCCTSGNCMTCRGKTPLGKSLRVEHFRTPDKALAETCAANYSLYDAKVKEVTA
jgi:hypothetical protein